MLTVPFCLDVLSDLLFYDSFPDGFIIFITNSQNKPPVPYRWDLTSTATADGVHVIRPTTIISGDPGRWINQIGGNTRVEIITGTTDANGNITTTWATAFGGTPHLSPTIEGGAVNQTLTVTTNTASGFTVNVKQRNSVSLLGIDVLLATTVNVAGIFVRIMATEKI